jgi:hypothetical protein
MITTVGTNNLAVISVISSALVGFGGILFAGTNSKQDRAARRALELELRQQNRKAEAYLELLMIVGRIGYWADMVRSVVTTELPSPPPELPDVPEQIRADALVTAFGSSEIQTTVAAWRRSVNAIAVADRKIAWALKARDHGNASPVTHFDVWNELEASLRPAEREARVAIENRVALELGHRV